MTNPSDTQYVGTIWGPSAEQVARIKVEDSGDSWVFQFGVDGPNVGLYSVTVSKFRVAHLNFLGALEVALRELTLKRKESDESGVAMYSSNDPKEITGG